MYRFAIGLLFLCGFGLGRSQLQLNLTLQCRYFGFQLLQLILLLPHTADGLLQNRNIPLVFDVLLAVLLHELGYALQRIDEIHRRRFGVGHRYLSVVVSVLECPLHEETVLPDLLTIFQGRFGLDENREAVQLADAHVLAARCGVLGNLL